MTQEEDIFDGPLTLVTHLVNVGRENWLWEKRTPEFYLERLGPLLHAGFPVVIIADAFFYRLMKKTVEMDFRANSVKVVPYRVGRQIRALLPAYRAAVATDQSYVNTHAASFRPWFHRDWSEKYFCLMHQRFINMGEVAQQNPFRSKILMQIDAGILSTCGWPGRAQLKTRPLDNYGPLPGVIRLYRLHDQSLEDYAKPASSQRFLGRHSPSPIIGGAVAGDCLAWQGLKGPYLEGLEDWLECGIPVLDQVLFSHLVSKNCSHFEVVRTRVLGRTSRSPYGSVLDELFVPVWENRLAGLRWMIDTKLTIVFLKELLKSWPRPKRLGTVLLRATRQSRHFLASMKAPVKVE